MTTTWRARCDRGHYLPTGEVPYSLEPECWDDTCRHKPQPLEDAPSAESFGHGPVWIDGAWFCARCRDHGHDEDGEPWSYPTRWPCTSAVVLGLVEREATA